MHTFIFENQWYAIKMKAFVGKVLLGMFWENCSRFSSSYNQEDVNYQWQKTNWWTLFIWAGERERKKQERKERELIYLTLYKVVIGYSKPKFD